MKIRSNAVLLITAFAMALLPGVTTAGNDDTPIRVMTRNIYVGADIFRVFEVDPVLIIPEIAAIYTTVLETNFQERAGALAAEIAAAQPHLIGLQEVSLVRRQSPGDWVFGNLEPALDVELDYLQILLDALAALGQNYSVAASVDNADVELPLFIDGFLDDIRLTDRDVILVRDGVPFANPLAGNFDASVIIEVVGAVIEFKRGWTAVNASVGGTTFHFVNTHMEVGGGFGAATQELQIAELIATVDAQSLPVVMLGDFNASPNDPPQQAYGQLLAAGYSDAWLLSDDAAEPGLTCCHEERLMNEVPALTSRIDHVFIRSGQLPAATNVLADVVGDEAGDRTASGLWPSDHAGVAVSLILPASAPDSDGDGVSDTIDNCTLIANIDQRDTDQDGFGNRCDGDFNQDGVVNFLDLGYLSNQFFSDDPLADLDGIPPVNFGDLGIMKLLFFAPPGPGAP